MKIRQPVINTFKRVGIPYEKYQDEDEKTAIAENWISGETVETYPLVAKCIKWVYMTQIQYDNRVAKVNLSDFDRVRHWILEVDPNAYSTCID